MFLILTVVSSVGLTLLYAMLVKLAAYLMSRTSISWPQSIAYAVLALISSVAISRLLPVEESVSFLIANLVLVLVINILIGGWFFHERAGKSTGEPLGWQRAFKLSAFVQLLLPFIGGVVFVLSRIG